MAAATVIELLGAPAAGKSGLAEALGASPDTVVVKDHARRDLPALLRAATRAWPALLSDPPPGTSRLRWAAWAGRLGAAPVVAGHRSASGTRLVVLDQGPAYTLGRMLDVRRAPRGSHWWHRQACETARLLDLLVVLDARPELLAERLRARHKQHRADDLDPAGTARYLTSEQQTCRAVADALGRAGARVLYLDTGRLTVEEQVEAVRVGLRRAARHWDRSA
jgi:hypothetical protein